MIIRRTRTHSWRWLKCLKSDRRNGKYAEMCLVSGDEGCLVVMVLVGFSVVGLLVASGPSGSFPALDWYLLVLVVLVDHSGVPVLAGHILCKWCFLCMYINTSTYYHATQQWLCKPSLIWKSCGLFKWKMTVRGTMVRSEVCNAWCFCLGS